MDIITIPNLQGRQLRVEYPAGHPMRRKSKRMSKSFKKPVKIVDDQEHQIIPKVETPKTGSIRKSSLPVS